MPNIQTWIKTPEGAETIESQIVFCLEGQLWQGWRKVAIQVTETLLTDEELDRVRDIDNSLSRVWFARRQRLEGIGEAKQREYDTRRSVLRQQRREIMSDIKEAKGLGIEPSPDDLAQLDRIDDRMKRLSDETNLLKLRHAHNRVHPEQVQAEKQRADEEKRARRLQCPHCESISPEGHKNPPMWLKGHTMACKKAKAARAKTA